EIDPLDGVTVFEYDEVGRTTAVIDPLGLRTQFGYDERGNLLKLTRPDGSVLDQVFDENDRLLARTHPGGGTERFEWNAHGLLAASVGACGGTHRFDYTGHGQLRAATDPRGGTTRFEFDRYGKLCVQVDAIGMRQRMEHDGLGRTLRRWDGSGGATSYTHDAKGRLLRMDFPGGDHVACEYDAEGRLVRHRDPSGAVTRLEYTGVDLLRKRIQPDGTATEYLYDSEGRLQSLINPNGETHQLRRDARGCIVEEVDYWGQRQHYELDAGGRIGRRTDALGRSVEFRLDAMGRTTRKRHVDPFEPARVLDETFRYDAGGRLLEARNAAGHVLRRYDAEGRVVHEEQNGFVVASSYDASGSRMSRVSDAGNRVVFDYDLLGRTRAVEVNDEPGIETVRNLQGQTVAERLGEALVRGYRYDSAGLLAIQALLKDDTELFRTEYDYDSLGDPIARTDSEYGHDTYAYDPVRRVVEHAGPMDGMHRWTTDRAGNRLHTRVLQVKRQAVVGSDLQVGDDWSREGDLDGVHYAFDRAGNLAQRQLRGASGQPAMHLRWDAEQRLVECAWSEGERQGMRVRFGYDPLGRRVFKRGPKETTWFFWDGDALLGEVTQANDEPDAAPLWVGNVANLHEAQLRKRRLKALHGQVREYVYRPGSHEPLMLIEVESVADDQAPLPREAPVSMEGIEPASAVTPDRPRGGTSEIPVASAAAVSVPAPQVANVGVSVPARGLGYGVRLGADSAEPSQAEGVANSAQVESGRPVSGGLGAGGRLSALALGGSDQGRSASESMTRDADVLKSESNPVGARALATSAGSSQVRSNGLLQAMEPAVAASEIAAGTTVANRADPSLPPGTRRVVYHFCNDLNGCPVRIIDATGRVVWGATHTPWGQVRALSTQQRLINPIRQQGQYFDRETGLCYNLARYYDPHAGCYISADPLGLVAGENTYLYAFGNPFEWADPWGLRACRRGEWIFPEGRSTNINDYDKIYTNGIMGSRADAQKLADAQRVPYYYNPTFADGLPKWLQWLKPAGLLTDTFETAVQKFGRRIDPLTQGFIDGLKGLDHPVTIVAHSQGTATVIRAVDHIPAGSTVVLRSPAISYDTAKKALDGAGLQDWKYIQPVGDIAPLYASAGPRQWLAQVRKINPIKAVNIHNSNGLGLGTNDFPGDIFDY
ncbi:RHS repeat-associated core domain-containing protein, partial [Lysobacter cavernae]